MGAISTTTRKERWCSWRPARSWAYLPTQRRLTPKGWVLLFPPDLLIGTPLGKHIHDYSFFSYDVNEALHLSEKERQTVLDCFAKITTELEQNIDKHSKTLIASNIELFLNYCTRFYDRQFITRDNTNKNTLQNSKTS